jgi:hypothetical protein
MIYARVHDQTVADDYYAAMSQVEKRLELPSHILETPAQLTSETRNKLLQFTNQLTQLDLNLEARLEIVAQIRQALTCHVANLTTSPPLATIRNTCANDHGALVMDPVA